jgi:hypothetical protein
MGSVTLEIYCPIYYGSNICIPKQAGTQTIRTTPMPLPPPQPSPATTTTTTATTCRNISTAYQSWQLDHWLRQYRLAPGSSSVSNDTGPSFDLTNLADGSGVKCASAGGETDGKFSGGCAAATADAANATVRFEFDAGLDLLIVREGRRCGAM